ncbi:cilia- and flagella-associated protein 251 [Eurytemora carolleeae]|uniref:cilia- and flagella-associated protein 251 n=1 Tax=Eurytemora carolleeae TaxID=1294199 RepID=UPI000C766DDC|nr:cilia- and flagella-associated protein 251 [Eurytemora carolleeae]|eukprot:XP_023327765.1 cilia- and flagella-associated protein 251-like [Eurytemora affinis]
MAGVLERKPSSSLFKETSAQRFRRESLEMWEKIQTEEKHEDGEENKDGEEGLDRIKQIAARRRSLIILKPSEKSETQKKDEIFPRRSLSKFVKTKPAVWEIKEKEEEEKEEKKEKGTKTKGSLKQKPEEKLETEEKKPVRRIGEKMAPGQNIRKI